MRTYAVLYERGERNWSAYVPDLPGCVATGKTREEAERRIREAIEFHIEGLRMDGEAVPEPTVEAGDRFPLRPERRDERGRPRRVEGQFQSGGSSGELGWLRPWASSPAGPTRRAASRWLAGGEAVGDPSQHALAPAAVARARAAANGWPST